LSMKSAQRQNHSIDVLHASIQHPVLVQPRNLALPESDSPKSGIHRRQWSLIENFRQKSVSNHAFKITAHENCVALSIILSIINQKRIIMLNKKQSKNQFMEIHACSSL
jgi:hypothetical protein